MERKPQTFWGNVGRGGPDECWPWLAGRSGRYGVLRWGGSPTVAHRVAWELTNGPIPEGHELDHRDSCEGICVNPAHLTPRTKAGHASRHHPPATECAKGHPLEGRNRMNDGRCRVCHNAAQRDRLNPEAKPTNTAKTHCPHGHAYTPENTYFIRRKTRGTVERRCRTCHKRRADSSGSRA